MTIIIKYVVHCVLFVLYGPRHDLRVEMVAQEVVQVAL